MAAGILSAPRRRNCTPTTSTLKMLIEDVDCSGLAAAPEDGEFVQAPGKTAAFSDDTFESDTTADVTIGTNAGLAMVWGSARRSDRAALGDSRVPVLRNGGRFKTKLFYLADEDAVPSANANGYGEGALLTVIKAPAALEGSQDRLVIAPLSKENGWVIGHCVSIVTDSKTAGQGEIEVVLYDQPRLHTTQIAPA